MASQGNTWSDGLLQALTRETGVSVLRDWASRAAAAEDYGHLVTGAPRAVAHPRTAGEIAAAVRFANANGLSFTGRGSGHCASGHSVSVDGVTLDLSRMDRVEAADPETRTLACEPGARLREVAAAASAGKMAVPVLLLNLDMTVGGVASVGGVGPATHKFGPLAANVAELEVVTGDGRQARCSPTEERDLFDATLANMGRCAIITKARLELRESRQHVRTFSLLYDDVGAWVEDQRALAGAGACDHMEGFCTASMQGLRNTPAGRRPFAHWFYGLHMSFEHDDGGAPDAAEALRGLHHYRLTNVEDNETSQFPARYDLRFEMIRRTGGFQQAHPLFDCMLPAEVVVDVLPRVIEALPLSLGDGHRLIFVAQRKLPRFFVVPEAREVALFAVLPTGVAAMHLEDTLKAIRHVHAMLVEAGGKRYVPGWLGMMDADGWQAHYGELYPAWREAKRRFDPNGVLASALFPAG